MDASSLCVALLLKDLTLKIKMTSKIFGLVIENICSSIRNQNMTNSFGKNLL